MSTQSVLTACAAVVLMLASTFGIRASDTPLLIELDRRSGALAAAVSASGAVVVGNMDGGGEFYWMPTTGAIFIGSIQTLNVSRDGRMIVGRDELSTDHEREDVETPTS
jgi:hypothetical protein